jgi:hypothetical protein
VPRKAVPRKAEEGEKGHKQKRADASSDDLPRQSNAATIAHTHNDVECFRAAGGDILVLAPER